MTAIRVEVLGPLRLFVDDRPVEVRGPKRRVRCSTTTGAGPPEAVGKLAGKSRMPRTSAPRKP